MDIVIERTKQGLCPICKKEIKEDQEKIIIDYNGQPVTIHFKHYKPNLI